MMTTKAAIYSSMAAPLTPMVKRHGNVVAHVDVKKVTRHGDVKKSQIDTPVGPLSLETSKDGLRAAYFDSWWEDQSQPEQEVGTTGNAAATADTIMREAKTQIQEYFAGIRKDFTVPLASNGTSFQRKAWAALERIPYGETICYEEQAISMGEPTKARAVGAANAKNPICLFVPCHRVIAKGGGLCGYAGGVQIKQYLLNLEAGRLNG
ncbi:unnamed protein product [Calypogeia fissa]